MLAAFATSALNEAAIEKIILVPNTAVNLRDFFFMGEPSQLSIYVISRFVVSLASGTGS